MSRHSLVVESNHRLEAEMQVNRGKIQIKSLEEALMDNMLVKQEAELTVKSNQNHLKSTHELFLQVSLENQFFVVCCLKLALCTVIYTYCSFKIILLKDRQRRTQMQLVKPLIFSVKIAILKNMYIYYFNYYYYYYEAEV